MNTIKAWWWSDGVLGYDDGRVAEVGAVHRVEGDPAVCVRGLHGSVSVLDALNYANSTRVWRVELGGKMDIDSDKIAAQSRRYLWTFDTTEVLLAFARRVALDVIDLWNAPDVARRFLETGDPALREAAWDAARCAALDAALDAARWAARAAQCAALDAGEAATWAAAWAARDAALDAAQAAAWAVARDAPRWAARDAGEAAAWAAWKKYNGWLETMIREARA